MTCQLEKWGHITSVGMVGVWFGCMTFYGGAYAKCFYFNIYIFILFFPLLPSCHVKYLFFFSTFFSFTTSSFWLPHVPLVYNMVCCYMLGKTKLRQDAFCFRYIYEYFLTFVFFFKHFISFLKYKNLKLRLRKNIQTNKKKKKWNFLKETKSATTSLCVVTFFLANHWYFIRHHRFTYLSIWNHQSFNANIFLPFISLVHWSI